MEGRILIRASVVLALTVLSGLHTDSAAQPLFEEVSAQLGIVNYSTCAVPFWYDWDLDGDLDLLMGERFYHDLSIYRCDGGQFVRLTNIGLPTEWDGGAFSANDFDHDGDLDLFVRSYHTPSPLLVYENGVFVDRTAELGLPWETGDKDYDWVDYDRDGWTDLLYGHYISGFHLYRNIQGTHFEDVTAQMNLPFINYFGEMADADVDLDGDVDLFITTYIGPDFFFVNRGNGVFEDWTAQSGLSGSAGRLDCRWVDFDHDKYPDLLTQGPNNHTIWHNNGNLTFTEMTVHGTEVSEWGSDYRFGAWYAVADFDMDGDYDFYAARPGNCGTGQQPNQFFIQDSLRGLEIWFHDVAPRLGMNYMVDGTPTVADFDGDGDLDLTVPRYDDHVLFFRNLINSQDRLQVQLEGPGGERDCWHSRIEVYPHGGAQALQAVELNTSNVGRNGLSGYFVLDANGHYDLRVYFPNGTVMTPENCPGLSDVVPSEVGYLLTVQRGLSARPNTKPAANEFRMEAAYPNPFNASTVIRYAIPADAPVRLAVYSVLGQHVSDLVNTPQNAGEHRIAWNASELPSGVYLLRLSTHTNSTVQKIVLMK